MRKTLKFILSLIFPALLFGQNHLESYKIDERWYRFEEGLNLSSVSFIERYKSEWGLVDTDDLELTAKETDDLGYTHYKYKQIYHGYDVEHTDFILHYQNGLCKAANAWVVAGLRIPTENPISEDLALNNALVYMDARQYAWENELMEQELKEDAGNEKATYFPNGNLILHHDYGTPNLADYYHFAWRFEITTSIPYGHDYVYIDAHTGAVLAKHSLILACNTPGSATTQFNGNQNITVRQRGFPYNDFVLEECGNRNIHTQTTYLLSASTIINQEADNSTSSWGLNERRATTAHWAAERTWDYYKYIHNRNGCDNANRQLKVFDDSHMVNQSGYDPVTSINDKIHIGIATNANGMGSLDVVGHEFTHGVTRYTAGLVYNGESGALNESFSDIFGTMVEKEVQPSVDWVLADEINGAPQRSMQNPSVFTYDDSSLGTGCGVPTPTPYPLTYQGTGWYNNGCDDNGVHINSSVQNRFYYLLCMGGSQNNMSVIGIGMFSAERIAFRALTVYLGQNSNYNDARSAWINAAIDLHGACSFQVIQVMNAWRAVGVNGASNQPVCIQLLEPSGKKGITYCSNTPITLTATTNLAPPVTYNWTVPSGVIISNQVGGQATFSALSVPNLVISVSATKGATTTGVATKTFSTKVCRLAAPGLGESEAAQVGEISLFPNPTIDKVTLSITDFSVEGGNVSIIDLQGRTLFNVPILSADSELDVQNIASGLYFIKINLPETEQIIRLEIAK